MTRRRQPHPIELFGRNVSALVQVPSITGDERRALECVGELATSYGLAPQLHQFDLEALRARSDYPGESTPRDSLHRLTGGRPNTSEPISFRARWSVG